MPTSAADGDQIVAQLVANATHEALRDVANQLAGLLWERERAATDAAEIEQLQTERRAVRARLRAIRPGSDAAGPALEEWGARVRALREP